MLKLLHAAVDVLKLLHAAAAAARVHLEHGNRLHDLGVERLGLLEQVEQLGVVHF